MSDLSPLLQQFLMGGLGTAVVLGIVRIVSEYIRHRRSSSESRLDNAETAKAMAETTETTSKTYNRIVADLRADRDSDRRELTAVKLQVDALNARIDSTAKATRESRDRADATAQRNGRNVRLLQKYAVVLCDLMRDAGLTPPPPPDLEPEPVQYARDDLRDAIPTLMSGAIANFGAKAPKDEPSGE